MSRQTLVRNSILGTRSQRHNIREAPQIGHGFFIFRLPLNFRLKNFSSLLVCSIASLQHIVKCASAHRFSARLPSGSFEEPASGFFQQPARFLTDGGSTLLEMEPSHVHGDSSEPCLTSADSHHNVFCISARSPRRNRSLTIFVSLRWSRY